MENISSPKKKAFWIIGIALGWFALVAQFYLIIINRSASLPEIIIRFFSFFTILTNILVALCFTFLLLMPRTKWGRFFEEPATLTAIAIYITAVGIVYNIILRYQWNPVGWQRIVDELLHSVIPVLFLLYWLLFAPKKTLQWKNIPSWLIFPALYCIYSLLRGSMVGFYPYPFLDANTLGYSRVLLNISGLVLFFVSLAFLFVGIAKLLNRNIHSVL